MKLKPNQPEFEVVSGLLKGRQFIRGREYESREIPKEHLSRFVNTLRKRATKKRKTTKKARGTTK